MFSNFHTVRTSKEGIRKNDDLQKQLKVQEPLEKATNAGYNFSREISREMDFGREISRFPGS